MAQTGLSLAILVATCLVISTHAGRSRPPPSPVAAPVIITVSVEGTISNYDSHENSGKNISIARERHRMTPDSDVITMLIDRTSPDPGDATNASASFVGLRVQLADSASAVVTGDRVQVELNIEVPGDVASSLQLDVPEGSLRSRHRRLLSSDQRTARRMLLGFQGSRRSVAEVQSLAQLLSSISQTPRRDPSVNKLNDLQGRHDKDLFIVNGQPQNITSVTFVFKSSSCSVTPVLNANLVRQYWYDNGDAANVTGTLQRYYQKCSYNQLQFKPANNPVYDVDIPCTGTMSKGPYNLKKGYGNGVNLDNELFALLEAGKNYLKVNYPAVYANWATLRRKLMIFPLNFANDYAPFAGLASMGCAAGYDCLTWLNPAPGDIRPDLPVAFQELAHNIGLAHSSRVICTSATDCYRDEYGDWSDPMGSATPRDWDKGVVCTNAPQAYKAGWASPITGGHINFTELSVGIAKRLTLPPMAANKANMIRVVTNQSATFAPTDRLKPERALYISYRVRQDAPGAYDSGLQDDLNNRVWVHEYNESANGLPASIRMPPLFVAMMTDDLVKKNKVYVAPSVPTFGTLPSSVAVAIGSKGEGLRITLKGKNATAATVELCRYTAAAEDVNTTCEDGLDNDCDGLADNLDPDCGVAKLASPPPPRPPPPKKKNAGL